MSSTTGIELMLKKIEEMKNNITESLANGNVGSFEEYRRVTGIIQGLDYSSSVIRDVEQRLIGDDDE